MHNPAPVIENNTHKLQWDFDIYMDHLISARRPDLILIYKKKRTCKIVDFAIPANHRIKLKEWEKKDKYLDLAKELKKLWNMQVTIIPIVIGAFGTVTKGLLKGLEDLDVGRRVETIQTTTLLRTARILRRVLETWGDLLSLRFQWKTLMWKTLSIIIRRRTTTTTITTTTTPTMSVSWPFLSIKHNLYKCREYLNNCTEPNTAVIYKSINSFDKILL